MAEESSEIEEKADESCSSIAIDVVNVSMQELTIGEPAFNVLNKCIIKIEPSIDERFGKSKHL